LQCQEETQQDRWAKGRAPAEVWGRAALEGRLVVAQAKAVAQAAARLEVVDKDAVRGAEETGESREAAKRRKR